MNILREAKSGITDALREGVSPRTITMAAANLAFIGIGLMIDALDRDPIGSYIERNVPIDFEQLERVIAEEGQL